MAMRKTKPTSPGRRFATYQKRGCWTPHAEITRAAYEKTLDIFEYNGLVRQRYPYEAVCAEPPAG